MSAVGKYNGVNAFTLKPNSIDTRNMNGVYTPNQVPQANLQYSYDPLHPSCYDGTSTTLTSLPGARGGRITLNGGMEGSFTQQGVFELDGVNDYGQLLDDIQGVQGFITAQYTAIVWIKAETWTRSRFALQYNTGIRGFRLDRHTPTFGRYAMYGNPNTSGNPQLAESAYFPVEENQWQCVSLSYASGGNPTTGYSLNSSGTMTFSTKTSLTQDWVQGGVAAELWGALNGLQVYWSGGLGEFAIYQTNLSNSQVERYFENTKKRYGY